MHVPVKATRKDRVVDEAHQDPFAPRGVDLSRPSVARVYDYYLGGTTNWAIDREFGARVLTKFPELRNIAIANRQFLFRVVSHLMGRGVRQFIDLGAGVPTMDHIHAVAERRDPGTARVIYVDNEPVAVAHSEVLLEEDGDPRRHKAINGDIRAPHRLWQQISDTGIIDLSQPVALLMIAVLHVQQRDQHDQDIGEQITAIYRDLLPAGSYLAISHITNENVPDSMKEQLTELKKMYDTSSSPVIWRSHQQISDLFGDFELLEPGLTWTPSWLPEEASANAQIVSFDEPRQSAIFAGVARKAEQ